MTKKHYVYFVAEKKVREPVVVDFMTKTGEEIKFPAHKKVNEEVEIDFIAKNK